MNKGITTIDGKFYKKHKVVILPTENGSSIRKTIFDKLIFGKHLFKSKYYSSQHLYILSDEEIKESDCWVFNTLGKIVIRATDVLIETVQEDKNTQWNHKKIIATTDPKLENCLVSNERGSIYQQLPRPSDAFLKAYCEKGGIDEVLVEYELYYNGELVPKEILHIHDIHARPNNFSHKLKVAPDNTITIKPVKDSWSKEEVVELLVRYGRDVYRKGKEHSKWIEENL